MSVISIYLSAKNLLKLAQAIKPKLYFLIGPPAVGKSTWINNNASGAIVVNRDDEIVKAVKETGLGTYDDLFVRPQKDVLNGLEVPSKEIFLAADNGDEVAQSALNEFEKAIKEIADNQNDNGKYGKVIPYSMNDLRTVIVNYGVPAQYVVPFEYSNVRDAEALVGKNFDESRNNAIHSGESIIIDMTNMNKSSRDSHRKYIVDALGGNDINDYYDQIAIVFAPEEGYSEEEKARIKEVGRRRAEEIKASGDSKTIPDSAYDRMFAMYEPPTEDEGFSEIVYVGVPSFAKLASVDYSFVNRRSKQLSDEDKDYFERKRKEAIPDSELSFVDRRRKQIGDEFMSKLDSFKAALPQAKEYYNLAVDAVYNDDKDFDFKEAEDIVSQNPYYSVLYAKDIPGADIERLQEVVKYDPASIVQFAKKVPSADIQYLWECLSSYDDTFDFYKREFKRLFQVVE